jgi:hypothetical protein
MLAGNVVAIVVSALICVVVSLIKPQHYDWALMKEIPLLEEDPNAHLVGSCPAAAPCSCLPPAPAWVRPAEWREAPAP